MGLETPDSVSSQGRSHFQLVAPLQVKLQKVQHPGKKALIASPMFPSQLPDDLGVKAKIKAKCDLSVPWMTSKIFINK